jgi:hypothetical protein
MVFGRNEVPVWWKKFKDGQMAMNGMTHRNTDTDQEPHTLMKIVSLLKV